MVRKSSAGCSDAPHHRSDPTSHRVPAGVAGRTTTTLDAPPDRASSPSISNQNQNHLLRCFVGSHPRRHRTTRLHPRSIDFSPRSFAFQVPPLYWYGVARIVSLCQQVARNERVPPPPFACLVTLPTPPRAQPSISASVSPGGQFVRLRAHWLLSDRQCLGTGGVRSPWLWSCIPFEAV